MGYLNEDGLATLVGKVKGQVVQLTSAEYRNLPASKNSDNKTYFVTDEDYAYAIDDEPTINSDNLVKSGGVYTYTSKIGSGTLTTTAQTIIPAINELDAAIDAINTSLNDSGEGYVKLPDGTLICYGETGQILPDNFTGKTSGAIYYHEYSVSITFPVQFYSGLRVIVSRKDGRECSVSWVRYTNVGINEIDTIGGVQTLNNNNPVVFVYIAIGRWKA